MGQRAEGKNLAPSGALDCPILNPYVGSVGDTLVTP